MGAAEAIHNAPAALAHRTQGLEKSPMRLKSTAHDPPASPRAFLALTDPDVLPVRLLCTNG
jgi:hypothetical protein